MADLGGIAELALGRARPAKPSLVDTGGAFAISELTGGMRQVVLTGRGLPYRPFELETTQRGGNDWLPGYAVATATLLGASEEPCTINGMWKERFIGTLPGKPANSSFLGDVRDALVSASASLSGGFGDSGGLEGAPISVDGRPVTTVLDAVDLFDDIVRQGQELEVSWLTQVRHGILRSFKKRFHNSKDVEWELRFEWTSRGEPVTAAVHALDVTAKDTRDLLEGALSDIEAILDELPAIARELQDLVTSQLQKIQDLVDQVGDAVSAVQDIVSLPVDSAKRIVSLLQSIESNATDTSDQLDSRPAAGWNVNAQTATRVGGTQVFLDAEADGNETGDAGITRLTAIERAQSNEFIARMKLQLRVLKQRALERRVQMARQIRSELAGIFVARAGDDLRDAAFQFYGDSSEWRRIMLFNGLRSTALEPGQVVQVPRLAPSGESGDMP